MVCQDVQKIINKKLPCGCPSCAVLYVVPGVFPMTNAANDHKIMLVMVWTAMVSQLKKMRKEKKQVMKEK